MLVYVHADKLRQIWFDTEPSLFIGELPPTKPNLDQIERFVGAWLAFLNDSPRGSHPKRSRSSLNKFYWGMRSDLRGTIARLAGLGHQFSKSVTNTTTDGLMPTRIVKEILQLPCSPEYVSFLKSPNQRDFRYVYNFLTFGKKLPVDDPQFVTNALSAWFKTEERLSSLVFDQQVLRRLRAIMDSFQVALLGPFTPKHGPGHVFERGIASNGEKNEHILYHPSLDYAFFRGCQYRGEGSGYDLQWVIPRPADWIRERENFRLSTAGTTVPRRFSRRRLVFKDYKSYRSMSMEEARDQYFQQGVLAQLVRGIKTSPVGRYIRFEDQSWNRRLAAEGSATNQLDTLDLSAASDSVHIDLVRAIFPPSILRALLATRSEDVLLPDGNVVTPFAFAPMGSALCFPVQSLVYASLVVYAGIQTMEPELSDRRWSLREYKRLGLPDFGVYGDDIVCDARTTSALKDLMTRLGFVVNESKSYTGDDAFRESCGGYYVAGGDVTPYLYKVAIDDLKTAKGLFSMLEHINLSYAYGYPNLGAYYVYYMKQKLGYNPFRFVQFGDSVGIKVKRRPNNRHLRTTYNPALQRQEYWCVASIHQAERPVVDEEIDNWYRYVQFLMRSGDVLREANSDLQPSLPSAIRGGYSINESYRGTVDAIRRLTEKIRGDVSVQWGWHPTV